MTDVTGYSHVENMLDENSTLSETNDVNDVQFLPVDFVKEEVVECEEVPMSNVSSIDSDSSMLYFNGKKKRVDSTG